MDKILDQPLQGAQGGITSILARKSTCDKPILLIFGSIFQEYGGRYGLDSYGVIKYDVWEAL